MADPALKKDEKASFRGPLHGQRPRITARSLARAIGIVLTSRWAIVVRLAICVLLPFVLVATAVGFTAHGFVIFLGLALLAYEALLVVPR